MVIYIDNHYVCHTENQEGYRAFDVEFFDGKCKYFIEHYRYVPAGESWTSDIGLSYEGEFVAPTVNSAIVEAAQSAYMESQEQIDMLTECLLEMSEIIYE